MGLFDFLKGKKKEEELVKCDCGGMCKPSDIEAKKVTGPSVKVLGSGCAKCNDLEAATKTALENLGMDNEIDHVREFSQIASYGVMSTPALVVDGKVVSYGKVLKVEEVETILKKVRNV